MATHSSILAWRIPWTEEPGGLQSTRSQRVGHNWAIFTHLFTPYSYCVELHSVFILSQFICVVRAMDVGSDGFILISTFRFLVGGGENEFLVSEGPGVWAFCSLLCKVPHPHHDHSKDKSAPLWPQPLRPWWVSSGWLLGSLLAPGHFCPHPPAPPPPTWRWLQARGMAGWSLIRLRGKEEPCEATGQACHHTDPSEAAVMGHVVGPRPRPAPANLINRVSLAAACLHLPERAVFIPPRQVPGQTGLNWIRPWSLAQNGPFTGPAVPLAKQTPGPYGGVGKLAGCVAGGQPHGSLHGPAQKKGRGAKPALRDRCPANSQCGLGEPGDRGWKERPETWGAVDTLHHRGGSGPSHVTEGPGGLWKTAQSPQCVASHGTKQRSRQDYCKDDMRGGTCPEGLRVSLWLLCSGWWPLFCLQQGSVVPGRSTGHVVPPLGQRWASAWHLTVCMAGLGPVRYQLRWHLLRGTQDTTSLVAQSICL